MLFHSHLLLGVVFFLIFGDFFSGGNSLVFFLFVLLGSILPDIDEKHSKISQWTGIIGKISSFFLKHRGIAHSIPFVLVLVLLLKLTWSGYYAKGLFIGYISHLVGDMITPMGIKPLHPFSSLHIRGPIRTGGIGEYAVSLLLLAFVVYAVFL